MRLLSRRRQKNDLLDLESKLGAWASDRGSVPDATADGRQRARARTVMLFADAPAAYGLRQRVIRSTMALSAFGGWTALAGLAMAHKAVAVGVVASVVVAGGVASDVANVGPPVLEELGLQRGPPEHAVANGQNKDRTGDGEETETLSESDVNSPPEDAGLSADAPGQTGDVPGLGRPSDEERAALGEGEDNGRSEEAHELGPDTAPGQLGDGPGQSALAPGQQDSGSSSGAGARGNSADAPGQTNVTGDEAPGRSGVAADHEGFVPPGMSGVQPGLPPQALGRGFGPGGNQGTEE
jgi:hypothetical protein